MSRVDRGRRLFVGAAAVGTALAIARPGLGRAAAPAGEPRRRVALDTWAGNSISAMPPT